MKAFCEDYGRIPNTVTAGGITFATPEFLYLMSQAIYQLGNSDSSSITYITNVSAPQTPSGSTISSKQLNKTDYISVANNVAKFIKTNNISSIL